MQAKGAHDQGVAQGQIEKNNAILAGYRQADAIQQGAYREAAFAQDGRRAASAARVAAVANNIDASSGSMANVQLQSRVNAAIDGVRARAQAARVAWGFANEEQDFMTRARTARRAGDVAALGAGISGIGAAASAFASSRGSSRSGG